MSWKPGERAEFEERLKQYLAQRDAFVVTREVLSALARGDFAAQRTVDQMLGQRWPR